jgi:hypothetical protein
MIKKEIECPCEGASEENCEDCQDLPKGTLEYWRNLVQTVEVMKSERKATK